MTRQSLTPMTKVEVVITGDDLPALREVLTAAGATGYTSVANVLAMTRAAEHTAPKA